MNGNNHELDWQIVVSDMNVPKPLKSLVFETWADKREVVFGRR